jgi:hypothetical protein
VKSVCEELLSIERRAREKNRKMSLLIPSIFTLLVLIIACSFIDAKVLSPSSDSQSATKELQKRPTVWLKTYPLRRSQTNVQNIIPGSDMEFIDDSEVKKRYDNYGHMRFGKRGGPGEGFDDYGGDYGHWRFGR